ncbi:hypothetical protein A6770_21220 [Nostoc minutum NIES-26]|uniref:Uncharacterized protein n=1 Tax=Nostoc minutum NIES-26 TaxID=1844469 RepID=A0A367R327_9NOSO|nr:hypothetical protein A6770_21220 [Nostoc minutum NIES-26]
MLPKENPFGLRGRITDPTKFFNREELIRQIFEELSKGSNLSLVGETQIGKSSILSMICQWGAERLQLPSEAFIYIDMQIIHNELEFFEALCEKLKIDNCRGYKLARNLRGKRHILCIDEIEKMTCKESFTWNLRSELRGLAGDSDSPLSLVIASRSPLKDLFDDCSNETSPLAGICNQPAFHCYLYQAAPECYQLWGVSKIRRTWGISAYRSLYLMTPVAVFLLALFLAALGGFYFLWTLQSHTSSVESVAVTSDGQQVVSASSDKTLKVWELKSGKLLRTLSGHTELIWGVVVTPNGQQVISASRDKTLKVWELKSGKLLHNLSGHTDWVTGLAVTPNGQQVVSGSADNTLKIWELKSSKLLHTINGHTDIVWAVAITPNGQRVVSGSADKTLKVWELKSSKLLYTLSGHTQSVVAVAVTPDGQQVISASRDKTLKVWELKSGKLLRTLSGHNDRVVAVAVTPDGQQVISASRDKTLKVWEFKSGKLLHTFSGHTNWVNAVAVTPDGQQVVSGSQDKTLKVWELNKGKVVVLQWARIRLIQHLPMLLYLITSVSAVMRRWVAKTQKNQL